MHGPMNVSYLHYDSAVVGKVIVAVKTDVSYGICAVLWPCVTSSYSWSQTIFFPP